MKAPSFQFYPGDWLRDPGVRSLTRAERGDWIDLLSKLHEMPKRGYLSLDGINPISEKLIANMLSTKVKSGRALLDQFLRSGVLKTCSKTGLLYNKRMVDDERLLEVRRKSGELGGQAKGKQTPSKSLAKGKQKASKPPSKTDPLHLLSSSSSSEEENKHTVGADAPLSVTFGLFWEQYPRKTKKETAWGQWKHLKPDKALRERIGMAVQTWKASDQWRRGIIPHGSAWLHQKRWEDEVPKPIPNPQSAARASPDMVGKWDGKVAVTEAQRLELEELERWERERKERVKA